MGYSKAEVTRGGVDTDELSSKTLEAKNVPGLYFIGEVGISVWFPKTSSFLIDLTVGPAITF